MAARERAGQARGVREMKSACADMAEVDQSMTNFDHSIDPNMEQVLMAAPGKVFGRHHGWDFNGKVWYADDEFHEEVWVYHQIRGVRSASSLAALMATVNEEFGDG